MELIQKNNDLYLKNNLSDDLNDSFAMIKESLR